MNTRRDGVDDPPSSAVQERPLKVVQSATALQAMVVEKQKSSVTDVQTADNVFNENVGEQVKTLSLGLGSTIKDACNDIVNDLVASPEFL
ncbi:hypothetical protein ACOSP7_004876 [Xanthoceras sorbifolium]